MTAKKDLVIVALSTFCLTVTLFMILPTESSPGSVQYNPWLDTNDDGQINIVDVAATARAFGTSGDPTKSVVIAGNSVEENTIDFAVEYNTQVNITIPTAGFRIMTVSIFAHALPDRYFEVFIGYRVANKFVNSSIWSGRSDSTFVIIDPEADWYENLREPKLNWTEEVRFSELVLVINNPHYPYAEQPLTVSVVYYLST